MGIKSTRISKTNPKLGHTPEIHKTDNPGHPSHIQHSTKTNKELSLHFKTWRLEVSSSKSSKRWRIAHFII